MDRNTSQNFYLNYLPVNSASETWSVNGANGISSFTFANSALIPTASNYSTIPAIINKGSGFTLNINNVANISNAELIVFDGTSSSTFMITFPMHAGNNVITVTSAHLSALSTAPMGS
jgi:hypothetical protein